MRIDLLINIRCPESTEMGIIKITCRETVFVILFSFASLIVKIMALIPSHLFACNSGPSSQPYCY